MTLQRFGPEPSKSAVAAVNRVVRVTAPSPMIDSSTGAMVAPVRRASPTGAGDTEAAGVRE